MKLASGKKPVIFTGDLNVAHQPIDIARPKPNYNKTAGYMQSEIDVSLRFWMRVMWTPSGICTPKW